MQFDSVEWPKLSSLESGVGSFGGFVVTYRRSKILAKTIETILNQTRRPDLLLVVDNSDDRETADVARSFHTRGVKYENTGANLGSAGGFAYGVRRLVELGANWIYCGDDDNPPMTADTCERILNLTMASKDIGVAGAIGARFDWSKGQLVRYTDEELRGPMDVDFIGQGHSFTISSRVIPVVGLPKADLFFGYPDLEYSLRIRRAGFRMVIEGDLMLEQRRCSGRLGIVQRQNVIPHRPLSSIWRNYYTTRSYIDMMQHTFSRPDLARREALKALGRTLVAWRKGMRYGSAFAGYQIRGVWDGYRGRLGPKVKPVIKSK